jgi:hypothetical protein
MNNDHRIDILPEGVGRGLPYGDERWILERMQAAKTIQRRR